MPSLTSILALATAVPHLVAARADKPPTLDGRLDDLVWQKAAPGTGFTQKVPVDGKPPGDPTTVRVLYDDEDVYVAVDCPQSVPVVARLTRRDRMVEADSVSVILDTRSDGKSAFEFTINAASVLADALHFNDTDYNQDWDENWEGAAATTKAGWSAELRIPLRALRFPTAPVQSWGLQVKRYVSARRELDEWAHIPRDAAGEVSGYGRLDELRGLRAKTSIELRPFAVAGLRYHDPEAATLARGFAPSFSGGFDLKWHVSQALTLDATFLPDFGQVEADQVILNLSTYELFFPEKRPFFLEGTELFSTPLHLLYTRRIGRAPPEPELVVDPPIAEQLVDSPSPSKIYGAVKLAGDLGGGWSVGQIVALTGRRTVEAQAANGARVDRLADPHTAYQVLRLKRDLGRGAHVGLMFTSTNRLENGFDYPLLPGHGSGGRPTQLCPSGDELTPGARCFHDAYVASVDGRWRSPSGEYVLTGQAIATLTHKGPPRTMPNGTVIKSGDAGPAVIVKASKEAGKHLTAVVEYEIDSKHADYNDLGFQARQDLQVVHTYAEFRTLAPALATLETHTGFDFVERDNLSFVNQTRAFTLMNSTKFKNFWWLYAELHYHPPRFDDREVGDGAALERAGYFGAGLWGCTDSRDRVYGEIWTQADFLPRGVIIQSDAKLSVKALPQWDIDLLPSFLYAAGEPRFIGTDGDAYIFGRLRAQSLSVTLRSTYTFTPRLTLQAYAQAILESLAYQDYTWSPARGAGTVIRLAELRGPISSRGLNANWESGIINASLVLRWEYRLGSTLYVVYTHAQHREATPPFGEGAGFDLRKVTPRAAEEALMLKLSYWWG